MIGETFRRGARTDERELLIDRYLPAYDATRIRHVVVDATPEEAYDAAREVDLTRIGLGPRLLGELRYLPARVLAWLRGSKPPETPESITFDDVTGTDFVTLAEEPGEEFVLGAIGTFWTPDIEWVDVEPGEFAVFDRPGYAKLAIGISVRPYGAERSLVTYEARTATTDGASRRRFRRYWTVIGPFAGYLMARFLDSVKADAERRTIAVE